MNRIVVPAEDLESLRTSNPYIDTLLRFYDRGVTRSPFNAEGSLVLDRKEMGLTAEPFQALRKAIEDGYVRDPAMRAFLADYFGVSEANLESPTLFPSNTYNAPRRVPRAASAPSQPSWSNNYNTNNHNYNNNSTNTYNRRSMRKNIRINSNNSNTNWNNNTRRHIRRAKANYTKYAKSGRKTMKQNLRSRLVTPWTHKGGFMIGQTLEDEKNVFRGIMEESIETHDPQQRREILFRMARFLMYSQELVKYESFRQTAITKLQEMRNLPSAPPHLINMATAALARLEAM